MLVKLQSGMLEAAAPGDTQEIGNSVERRALLVYCGKFQAMDGEVEVDEKKLQRLAKNHNSMLSKLVRLATGELPVKGCPPVQLDHSTSAKDTVGRVTGELELGDYTTEDGKAVKALYSKVRVLGKENVEKVMDGRWQHLSVGADFEEGKLSELSITPFPAAAEASMLTKGKMSAPAEVGGRTVWRGTREDGKIETITVQEKNGSCMVKIDGTAMAEKPSYDAAVKWVEKYSRDNGVRLSEGEGMDEKEKLKKRLMEDKKMSEKEVDEKLAAMSDEDVKKMWGEECDKDKMAAEEKEKEEKLKAASKLTAARAQLTKLSTDFRSSIGGAQLALKKSTILSRLSKLRASAKITPAEVKKIELDKLAASNDATIEAVMKSYEDREPVIMVGALGSVKAEDLANIGKKQRMSTLEAETRANMSMLAKTAQKPAPGLSDALDRAPVVEDQTQYMGEYSELCKMVDEGKKGEVKDRLKAWMSKRMSGINTDALAGMDESQSQMSALAESVKTLQNQFEGLEKLAQELVGKDEAQA